MIRTKRFLLWISLSAIMLLSGCTGAPNPANNDNNQPTQIVVRILNLDITPAVAPSPTMELFPSPVVLTIPPTNTPLAIEPTTTILSTTVTPRCTNQAEFVRHLTIPEHTSLNSGQYFIKIWQIKNTGTCTWTTDYSLRFYSGDQMNGPPSVPFPYPVPPGEVIDLEVTLITPSGLKTTSGFWVLSDAEGGLFGTSANADQPIIVLIDIKPTPKPTPG